MINNSTLSNASCFFCACRVYLETGCRKDAGSRRCFVHSGDHPAFFCDLSFDWWIHCDPSCLHLPATLSSEIGLQRTRAGNEYLGKNVS